MKEKSLLKILVPALIIVVIVGMWLVKNRRDTSGNPVSVQQEAAQTESTTDDLFALRETEAIDFEKMASFGIPLIVDYGADTCIPCKEMAPVLEKANAELPIRQKAGFEHRRIREYNQLTRGETTDVCRKLTDSCHEGNPVV